MKDIVLTVDKAAETLKTVVESEAFLNFCIGNLDLIEQLGYPDNWKEWVCENLDAFLDNDACKVSAGTLLGKIAEENEGEIPDIDFAIIFEALCQYNLVQRKVTQIGVYLKETYQRTFTRENTSNFLLSRRGMKVI